MADEKPTEDHSREVASMEALLGIAQGVSPQTGPYAPVGHAPVGGPSGPDLAPFVPGQVLAGRYRIVALLGRGGMGEVYRADDLTLGQAVALKFLPNHLTADVDRLERFRHEVRVARQVSHPNVCRVYDIGEAEGRPFLTMEYIVGEDLASYLRRFGGVLEEKGVELARQLCWGLAAVHEQGLLHRDLKPANVMVDSRGRVRLTDFGLAVVAENLSATEVRSGTPAYMAPEQLAGQEVSVSSDLFALGLVLYEVFTGRRAFLAATREELARRYAEGAPSKPSSHVSHLSPAVEQTILRCLENDPARRPRSATAVAVALDPLAAALAAGETPSPQLVADAGEEGILRPAVGAALLATVLIGTILFAWLNDYTAMFRKVPQQPSPEVLAHKAREVLDKLGYTKPPGDTAYGLMTDVEAVAYLRKRDTSAARWDGVEIGRPAVIYFWYRQSPSPLVQRLSPNDTLGYAMPGRVTPTEPPLRQPGMTCVFLDLTGRLIELHAVPPRSPPETGASASKKAERTWRELFRAAGLEMSTFRPAGARRDPPVFCTDRAAWEGSYPNRPDLPVRVEAAIAHGRPVYFYLGSPEGSERLSVSEVPPDLGTKILEYLYVTIQLTVLTLGAWLAWRNVRAKRANVPGALRLAGLFAAVVLVKWALMAKHAANPNDELAMLAAVLGRVLLEGSTVCLAYLALEPHVRRHWPWRIIGWNRLLEGRWRDPLVGQDVLIGAAAGVTCALLLQLGSLVPTWLGWASTPRQLWEVTLTGGPGALLDYLHYTMFSQLLDFFLLFLLLLALRRAWLVVGVWFLLRLASDTYRFEPDHLWLMGALPALRTGVYVFVLLRFGLLAFVVSAFCNFLLHEFPLTTDWSAWYSGTSLTVMATLGALAGHGFVRSLGGRPLLRAGLFGDE